MADYRLSERAYSDLEGILLYSIETFGLERAERYRDDLARCFRRVANDPRLGRPVPGRTHSFYRYSCERHAIFFTRDGADIFIVRTLHASMDFKRHLPSNLAAAA